MSEGAPRRRFQPTAWATLAALAGCVALLALGTWQVQRQHWKQALIAGRTIRMAAPVVTLPADLAAPSALEHRRFSVTGDFQHEQELYLGSKTYRGQVGFRVITPFELTDGRLLLIDRGWVPVDRKDPARRRPGQLEGQETLEGVARRDGWKGNPWFRPDNQPEQNYWFWVDLGAMAARIGRDDLITQIYLEAAETDLPGGLPKGHPGSDTQRNDHLQYAITWYALAFALAVIYVLFSCRPKPADE